jgi:patatin-like phospholipase/acyl hydrolase
MAYKILSISGGGIRGVIPTVVLKHLEERVPDVGSVFDLVAGTSTGGLIALALAAGMKPSEILDFYRNYGAEIFSRSWWRVLTSMNGLIRAKYDNDGLRRILNKIFAPELTLGNLKHQILIPCFRLDGMEGKTRRWQPVFFHNSPGSPYLSESIVDIALRATAAPTFFPSYQGYIDGGVVVNNPTTAAIAHARAQGGHPSSERLIVVSLATGFRAKWLEQPRLDWGLIQWARHLVPMIIQGTEQVVSYESGQLCGRSE